MLRELARLATLGATPQAELSSTHVGHACEIIRAAVGAEDAYVLQAGDPHFTQVREAADPTRYEIKQGGYGLVWRRLAARPEVVAGTFSVTDRMVHDPAPLAPHVPCTHVAMILPAADSQSEIFIMRGPWPAGMSEEATQLLTAARPALAAMVANVLDVDRQSRQRHQLSSVGRVAEAISQTTDPAKVLEAVCTALATASGFDWVNIYVLDADCRTVVEQSVNVSRYSTTNIAAGGARGAAGEELDKRVASLARRLMQRGRPDLAPDLLEGTPQTEFDARLRKYYERAHISSMASFPMVFHGRLFGMVTFSSSARRSFGGSEVELLSALVSQATTAVESIRLNRERRELQDQLEHQAFHDPLTDLPNRALFLNRLSHAVERAAEKPGLTVVALLDLDDFKLVNDTMGHARGDELLIGVSQRLKAYSMPADTVARLGGDEFTVLIDDQGSEVDALARVTSLLQVFESPFFVGGRELFVGASVGFVAERDSSVSADDLVRRADLAMYEAKRLGKGGIQAFNDSLQSRAINRFDAEADLRRGLECGEFFPHYQPIVDLNSQAVVGFEALARWQHPSRGLLPPSEFIELAESCGLIATLGLQILRTACTDANDWLRSAEVHEDFRVAINLSVRQLERPNIVEEILEVVREVGIESRYLELEVTETSMMADGDAAVTKLYRLREAGIRISIDDFGTGYSSLSYLKRLPVDTVKIDRSFVAGIASDASDAAIVQAVVAFARCIGLKVIVEGVESGSQANEVRIMGCDRAQGYYFARPMTAADALRSLSDLAAEAA